MKKLSKSGTAFRNKNKHKSTELSKHIWELKGNSIQHQISCNRASRAQHYNDCTRKCDLCLTQKLIIAKADPSSHLRNAMSSSLNVDIWTIALVKPSYSKRSVKWYSMLNILFKQYVWILDWTCLFTLQIIFNICILFLGKLDKL